MPLSRFFGRGKDASPPPPPPAEPESESATGPQENDEEGFVAEGDAELIQERSWRQRAEAVLPTGASTGSKRASALYGDADADLPTHFVSARGCRVVDTEGTAFLDCTMALGAVSLGYGEQRVTAAVVEAATQGNVSPLSSWREVELAERLASIVPCAERVQLLKTGAEATAAAVRIARTYTGRSHVVASGYFGWHDWSSDSAGVPPGVRGQRTVIPFDDLEALESAVAAAGGDLAAIVLEPVVERAPGERWLQRARELATASGAALVFDEVKTGFRVAPGGWQELSGVTPDLASFGKAMANGYPLAAVVGCAALMDAARGTWISSTLASESTALAAALAVLDWHYEADICASLAENGREMRQAVERAIVASRTEGVHAEGIDPMWMLRWDDPARESRFLMHAMRAGVLFKRGAYNFGAMAHDDGVLREIEKAASEVFVAMKAEENA